MGPDQNGYGERYGAAYVGRLLTSISSANRTTLRQYLKAKTAAGLKPATVSNSAYNLYKLDKLTNGTPFKELQPLELTDAMLRFSKNHSPNTTATFAIQVKAFYAWLHGGMCPPAIRYAMKRKNIGRENHQEPIDDQTFRKLLLAAGDNINAQRACFHTWLLWAFWDTGFRISELLSLRRRSVRFHDDGATLSLPPDAPDLKTGPRQIFVMECVPALRAWLRMLPEDPETPLFPAARNPTQPMLRTNVDNVLQRIAIRAGVAPPHPHLFRHTRATRAARAGWNESQLRKHFGWSGSSAMPAHYVHLAHADLVARVHADVPTMAPPAASGQSHVPLAVVPIAPAPRPETNPLAETIAALVAAGLKGDDLATTIRALTK